MWRMFLVRVAVIVAVHDDDLLAIALYDSGMLRFLPTLARRI